MMSGVSVDNAAASAVPDASAFGEPAERRIVPTRSRLKAIDLLREMPVVRVLAARDFKVKYKQSVLGPIWLFFQPFALLAAFLVAFRGLIGVETGDVPYIVFALVGLSVWSFFQAAMTIGTASLVSSFHLVRLTPCPRLAFPVASVIASLPALGVTVAAAIVAAVVAGDLSFRVLLLPLAAAWLFILVASMAAISAALAVRARDVLNALPFLLQVGLFLTPVGYSATQLSDKAEFLIDLNPLTGVIEVWRWMMLSGWDLQARPVIVAVAATAILAALSWRVFSRLEVTMADDI